MRDLSVLVSLSCCSMLLMSCGDAEFRVEGEETEFELLDGIQTRERPEIGQMTMRYPSDGVRYSCTVALIEPNVIVTARHCLDWSTCESDACIPDNSVTFTDASGREHGFRMDRFVSFDRSGRVAQGSGRRVIDTAQNGGSHALSFDVAIARLSRSVPPAVATPTSLLRSHPTNGSRVTAWGYGCQNRASLSGGGFKQLRDFVMGQPTRRLCPGDSGGPLTQGRTGGVVYVNSGYFTDDGRDIFGDVMRFRGQIDTILNSWRSDSQADSQPDPQPQGGGCEYVCEGPNTRVKYCGGVEVARDSVCGATQECVSLSPTQTTCQNVSQGGGATPSGCYYQCVGDRTRIHYCDGVELGRQEICGAAQVCVNTSATTVSCQNR